MHIPRFTVPSSTISHLKFSAPTRPGADSTSNPQTRREDTFSLDAIRAENDRRRQELADSIARIGELDAADRAAVEARRQSLFGQTRPPSNLNTSHPQSREEEIPSRSNISPNPLLQAQMNIALSMRDALHADRLARQEEFNLQAETPSRSAPSTNGLQEQMNAALSMRDGLHEEREVFRARFNRLESGEMEEPEPSHAGDIRKAINEARAKEEARLIKAGEDPGIDANQAKIQLAGAKASQAFFNSPSKRS